MAALVYALGGPAEARLEREAVYQVELAPHDYSRCALSRLLHLERAVLKTEHLADALK